MMSVFSPGKRSCQNDSVKLLRGSFQPQTPDEPNPSTSSRAFMRKGSSRTSLKFSLAFGGRSQAPPSSFNNSSFSATNPRCSQNPSGLSACGGINCFFGPKYRPQACRSLVSIDVPERCAPAMQITVWPRALFFIIKRLNNDDWPSASRPITQGEDVKFFHRENPSYI